MIKSYFLATICLALTLNTNGQINLNNGLMAYYSFDGMTNDISGNNHNPTTNNSPSLVDDCQGNTQSAYHFNGVDEYLEIPNDGQIDFDNSDEFAFSLWIKAPIVQNTSYTVSDIISKWGTGLSDVYSYTLRINSENNASPGTIVVARYDGACANVSKIQSTIAYNDNQWHNVIFQKDNVDSLELYIDGLLVEKIEDVVSCSVLNSDNILLGMRSTSNPASDNPYEGSIDDLRIYNRPLNSAEIDFLASNCSFAEVEDISFVNSHLIDIYPNPLSGNEIYINNYSGKSIDRIFLQNLDGKYLIEIEDNLVPELPEGSYIISIEFSDKLMVQKRIIIL
ncbi:MAG: hypothetical protein ACJASQ_004292 [Crocinitomicaceae bacterium]|jgi:hypothetical protein